MSPPVRALAAAWLLLLASCAVTPVPRLAAPPDPDRVRTRLLQEQAATRTVRGLARLAFEASSGRGSAAYAVVVSLPDRARVEAMTPLGTTALVATVRADQLRVDSPLRHEYWTGRATPEALGRLLEVPMPPEPLLRLLAGLPPLPLRARDPRLILTPDGAAVRVESVDGEHWQRLWAEGDDLEIARGEVGRASEVLFRFAFADRRPSDGRNFPFDIRVEDSAGRGRLQLQYERLQLNLPTDSDLFDLPRPTDPRTRIIELGSGTPGRVAP
jgi:outer membrane biogenesis lipoprotein LolB